MSKIKITLNKEKCINCGSCIAEAPEYFTQDKDYITHLKKSTKKKGNIEVMEKDVTEDELKKIKSAQAMCPTEAIKVEETK